MNSSAIFAVSESNYKNNLNKFYVDEPIKTKWLDLGNKLCSVTLA